MGVMKALETFLLCVVVEKHSPEGSRRMYVLKSPPAAPAGCYQECIKAGPLTRELPEMQVTETDSWGPLRRSLHFKQTLGPGY